MHERTLSRWLVGLLAAALLLGPAGPAARADGEPVEARVVVAIDGDSILVTIDGEHRTVRYLGIDAPDFPYDEDLDNCFALAAWLRNAELVEGQVVRLSGDVSETDYFGRLLRYVYLRDGTFVNGQLVAEGLTHAVSLDPDLAHADELAGLANEARAAGLGLWEACPEPTAAPDPYTLDPRALVLILDDLGPDYGILQEGYASDGDRAFMVAYARDPATFHLDTLRSGPAVVTLLAVRTDSPEAAALALESFPKLMAPDGEGGPVPIEPIGDAATAYLWRQSRGGLESTAWLVAFRRENLVLIVATSGLAEGNPLEAAAELARASDARLLEILSGERPAAAPLGRSADRGTRPGVEEWATVSEFAGADRLGVVTDDGIYATVQQIGIRAPRPGEWLARLGNQQLPAGVVGQRVRLVPGGPDRVDAGVLRRHVAVKGRSAPLAADLLGAGSAWYYPDPDNAWDRHYRELQRLAISQRNGIWRQQPRLVAWTIPGSGDYLVLDPRLEAAAAALASTPVGKELLRAVGPTAPRALLGEAYGRIGTFVAERWEVLIDEEYVRGADPRAVAAVLAHELHHGNRAWRDRQAGTESDCFGREVEAVEAELAVWRALTGPKGLPEARHELEKHLNDDLADQEGGNLIGALVDRYADHCHLYSTRARG